MKIKLFSLYSASYEDSYSDCTSLNVLGSCLTEDWIEVTEEEFTTLNSMLWNLKGPGGSKLVVVTPLDRVDVEGILAKVRKVTEQNKKIAEERKLQAEKAKQKRDAAAAKKKAKEEAIREAQEKELLKQLKEKYENAQAES